MKWYVGAVREIGVSSVIRWQIGRHCKPRGLIKLTAKSLQYPVFARPGTTDQAMFHQAFIEHEYAPFDNLQPALIVDCGAYVGYSAAYFLSRFLKAQLICIEPEPSNFSLLQRNLSHYSDRCILINGAIWPEQKLLRFQPKTLSYRLWGRRVEESSLEGDVPGVTIPMILEMSKIDRISLLKIHIEYAEKELFSRNTEWLDQIDNLVIELHGQECTNIFMAAVANRCDSIFTAGELTFCRLKQQHQ